MDNKNRIQWALPGKQKSPDGLKNQKLFKQFDKLII
jgi:hypothetical protein